MTDAEIIARGIGKTVVAQMPTVKQPITLGEWLYQNALEDEFDHDFLGTADEPQEIIDAIIKRITKAAISALTEAGLAIRPVEPTDEMLERGMKALACEKTDHMWAFYILQCRDVYKAMLKESQ